MAQHGSSAGYGSRLLIIGGGFAGIWAAASAARLRAQTPGSALNIALVSSGDDLVIRPRLYQERPADHRVPLDAILGPIGVRRVAATVTAIDTDDRRVSLVERDGRAGSIGYDRLVLASGSQITRPALPGADRLFDIDTLAGAAHLDAHLQHLPKAPDRPGRYTAVVIGGGFTGIEIAAELGGRLGAIAARAGHTDPVRVVLVERLADIGPELGAGPRPVIEAALRELGVELRLGSTLHEVADAGAVLSDGLIPAATVIWTGGMRASALAERIPGDRDPLGRLAVDGRLRVPGAPEVFAAGDTAAALAEDGRVVLQSCQHAMPLGRLAGHNAAADLLGAPLAVFAPSPYVTCLDLGPAGAVRTAGWDRVVVQTGAAAKAVKRRINEQVIVPPLNDAAALLALAGPPAG